MTDRLAQATGQGGASSGTALSAVNDVRYPVHGDWCTHHPFVDASVPNVARIYDYLLGGKDNYSADRDAAVELVRLIPDALRAAHHNRRFLQRAVRFLAADAGVRQFVDIGTGLPTQGNVHEVAQGINPGARVLYVDYDPVVISHAQALLVKNPLVVAINRDLRDPAQIITHPALQALVDLNKPVAILLVAVLHFIRDVDESPRDRGGAESCHAVRQLSRRVACHSGRNSSRSQFKGPGALRSYDRAGYRAHTRGNRAVL